MQLVGKATIHPLLFYSGKIVGYLVWILLPLSVVGVDTVGRPPFATLTYLSCVLYAIGVVIAVLSIFNLGQSTALGIPTDSTAFKHSGLYRFSRNPMYVGFDLLTISSSLYLLNVIVFAAGLYSIFIYHLIILGEEKFLERRFGREYGEYRTRVRRYV